ncbi:MAG: histidine phosphatase family protein [Dehalococcoidia bacterium]
MTHLLLVRHGQTAWNPGDRFRGRADLDLDEVGVQQAEAAARRMPRWPVAAVYSSPLRRALRTAEILARPLGLGVRRLEGLIDIDYGSWQGLSPEEAAQKDGELYDLWLKSPQRVRFPQGESLEMVLERVTQALDEVIARHPGETIALVAHKVVCKVAALYLLGMDVSYFWKIEQDVCALSLFETRDTLPPVALMLNDTCHLRDL